MTGEKNQLFWLDTHKGPKLVLRVRGDLFCQILSFPPEGKWVWMMD